ncbi:MAG: thioredoxin [Erysipelotrichaceae bacterium]|nr:thioredoxin [Erysipelotrichaceae bacterium]
MIIHIESVQQFDELLAKGEVLVDFFATWCGPCKMLSPIIESVAAENPGLTVLKVDVDEVGALAQRYGIASIPTLIRFVDGVEKDKALGYMPKPKLLAFLGK